MAAAKLSESVLSTVSEHASIEASRAAKSSSVTPDPEHAVKNKGIKIRERKVLVGDGILFALNIVI
jgi:hypothetical protein